MKIKFFKIKKDYRKEDAKINPDIYWKILVIILFLAIVTSFVFAYNVFQQINKDDVAIVQNNDEKIGNKEKVKIGDALKYFSEREKKSNEILNSPSVVADPSL